MELAVNVNDEQGLREIERQYESFLDDASSIGKYSQRILDMVKNSGNRIIVSVNDLRKTLPERAVALFWDACNEIPCIERALRTVLTISDRSYASLHERVFVGFEGNFGQRMLNPRTLKSRYLKNLVCCEGIVIRASVIRPKLSKSVHFCPVTEEIVQKKYADMTSFDSLPTGSSYPTEDQHGNALETEFGLCIYRDTQTLTMQELPETAPVGQLPRSLDVIVEDDLTDKCNPGDRIRVIGVYRCLPNKQGGYTSGAFRTVLIANNIEVMSRELEMTLTAKDIKSIRSFGRMKEKALNILVRSMAPSIHGLEEVKRGILCLLVGGVEKHLPNGTRLRGDINVLLIGDPSVAKSQMLRYVLNIAPRAIATTGRGSTGVGLTAAVTSDPNTRERRLEAGAMVLGDRGVVCIDEFDKMSDLDRTAIHEVMEQGRVTIVKAGIQAKLNARCSILAAANPVFGFYNNDKPPMENIGMQDSILSRFDLLYVLLDERDSTRDMQVALHVANLHCYRDANEKPGDVFDVNQFAFAPSGKNAREEEEGTQEEYTIYEKNTAWLLNKEDEEILTLDFLKKFLSYARRIVPRLTNKACEYISNKYAEIRAFDEQYANKERTMPVTPRLLETMIRLSTAFAKIRLSADVTVNDAQRAYELLCYAIFKDKPEIMAPPKKRKQDELTSQESTSKPFGQKKKRKAADGEAEDVFDFQSSDSEFTTTPLTLDDLRKKRKSTTGEETAAEEETPCAISVTKYETFRRRVRAAFDQMHASETLLQELVKRVQEGAGGSQFTDREIALALERMSDENAIMIIDDVVVLI